MAVRPLIRVGPGYFETRRDCPEGHWTIMRHESDPKPRRWFAYEGTDDIPANDGSGHTRLSDVVAWIEGKA